MLGNEAVSNDGVFNFTGFTVITEPGTNFTLELTVNMESETSVLELMSRNFLIKVFVRKCLPGEEFTPDEKCALCPRGTYLLEAATEVQACEPCAANSICFGSNLLAPNATFWR